MTIVVIREQSRMFQENTEDGATLHPPGSFQKTGSGEVCILLQERCLTTGIADTQAGPWS